MDRDLKRAKLLISLVHDGHLSDEEYRFLEQAIARYPELKLEVYRHERLHDLVRMIPKACAPAGIEDRVLKAIRSEGLVKRAARIIFLPRRRFPVEAVGAVAAVVILFFAALISLPFLVGTDREAAVLPHNTLGISTASVATEEISSPVTGRGRSPAEDVALVPRLDEDREIERFSYTNTDKKAPPTPEIDTKPFTSGLSSSEVMTATGVTAEKVSKILAPTRDALLSTAKKEEPLGSTTYIYSPSSEPPLPIVLLIHNDDPSKIRKDIMDKAVSLGGTVTTTAAEGDKRKQEEVTGPEYIKEGPGDAISLPPEKMDELLDYLAASYPETVNEIQDLRNRKTAPILRIDVVPTGR